jgi:hypothetical protein
MHVILYDAMNGSYYYLNGAPVSDMSYSLTVEPAHLTYLVVKLLARVKVVAVYI